MTARSKIDEMLDENMVMFKEFTEDPRQLLALKVAFLLGVASRGLIQDDPEISQNDINSTLLGLAKELRAEAAKFNGAGDGD